MKSSNKALEIFYWKTICKFARCIQLFIFRSLFAQYKIHIFQQKAINETIKLYCIGLLIGLVQNLNFKMS